MSNSADICVREHGRGVYLYTHWTADDLVHVVRAGLITATQGARLKDPSYLTRILFCHMLTPEELYDPTGYGISALASGDKTITIDVDNQTIESEDYGIPRQAIKDFIYQTGDDDEDREEPDLED